MVGGLQSVEVQPKQFQCSALLAVGIDGGGWQSVVVHSQQFRFVSVGKVYFIFLKPGMN